MGRYWHSNRPIPIIGASLLSTYPAQLRCMCVWRSMKMSLGEFLSSHSIDIRQTELLLLQLMEAVIHLNRHQPSSRLHSHSLSTSPSCVGGFVWFTCCPVWARERCRISPPRFFLAECRKRWLNQASFFGCILHPLLFLGLCSVLSVPLICLLSCIIYQREQMWMTLYSLIVLVCR